MSKTSWKYHTDSGLANIYLHYILDLWFEKKIKKEFKGYAGLTRYAMQTAS